jgi:hypothetical protein
MRPSIELLSDEMRHRNRCLFFGQHHSNERNIEVLQFNPSLDVLYTQSENLRRARDEHKRIARDSQVRRQLAEVVNRDNQRKKLGWRRPFYPAGA